MKHTECKDCELRNGDCGYHFEMDGTTDFDIASLSACDKYGNCMFYKPKANPTGDLISREALKEVLIYEYEAREHYIGEKMLKAIDNAPTVESIQMEQHEKILDQTINELFKCQEELEKVRNTTRSEGEWIGNAFDEHHCSRCGHSALWEEEPDGYYEVQSRFCPNCGADMQKGGAK